MSYIHDTQNYDLIHPVRYIIFNKL